MRISQPRLLALAAMAGAALTLMNSTAAFAEYHGGEVDLAAASGGPTGTYYCTDADAFTGAYSCFKPEGDLLYIKDTVKDGYSAVAEWGYPDGSNGRTGSCVNKLGSGNWGVCNKDFTEGRFLELTSATYVKANLIERGNTRSICCT
ncbi:hypothetical protein [Streptomyces sp. uw30]|uniref:hypothetical protein n=1 Tax=Streptomyces sp. uw30 TaxID=1828179 RepID=UPI001650E82E|nr:hypothetical protein [Streptomyces sp. uw30]